MEKPQLFPTCTNYRITVNFRNLIPVLLFSLLVVSCDTGRGPKSSVFKKVPYLVDIENSINNEKPVSLSDLGKTIRYIPLETAPDLALGSISNIVTYKSYFIVSSGQQIYLFDTSGHFLTKIGKYGRGPGEYLSTSICVDPYNDLICVYSDKKIIYFDFEGNLVDSYKTEIASSQFFFIDKDTILFSNLGALFGPETDETIYQLIKTDRLGNVVSQIYPVPKRGNTNFSYYSLTVPLYNFDNRIFFKSIFSDSLYCFENGQPTLYATFNLGKLKLDVFNISNLTINNGVNNVNVLNLHENDKYIFVDLTVNLSKSPRCLYDKKTSEFIMLKDRVFQNDLDGGLGFWPKYYGDDGTLVSYVDAITLLKHVEGMDFSKSPDPPKGGGLGLKELKDVITEFSNPVVILLKR